MILGSLALTLEHVTTQAESTPTAESVGGQRTHDKVERMLNEAGFVTVWTSTSGGSIAAPMRDTTPLDTSVRDGSVYVEAPR